MAGMTYAGYVLAAYLVFVVVLLWDFVAPHIRIRRLLRGVRLLAARRAANPQRGDLDR